MKKIKYSFIILMFLLLLGSSLSTRAYALPSTTDSYSHKARVTMSGVPSGTYEGTYTISTLEGPSINFTYLYNNFEHIKAVDFANAPFVVSGFETYINSSIKYLQIFVDDLDGSLYLKSDGTFNSWGDEKSALFSTTSWTFDIYIRVNKYSGYTFDNSDLYLQSYNNPEILNGRLFHEMIVFELDFDNKKITPVQLVNTPSTVIVNDYLTVIDYILSSLNDDGLFIRRFLFNYADGELITDYYPYGYDFNVAVYQYQSMITNVVQNVVQMNINFALLGQDGGLDYVNLETNDLYTNHVKNSDNKMYYAFMIQKDDLQPVFTGQQNVISNVDNPKHINDILAEISVYDEIDGYLTPTIVKDDFSSSYDQLGKYEVILSATDTSGNTSTFSFWVHVVDITPPSFKVSYNVINLNKTYDGSVTPKVFRDNIYNELKANVTDNYDGDGDLTVTQYSDNFTENQNKVGTYNIIYLVKDASNNTFEVIYKVTVTDYQKPVFSGNYTFTTSYKTKLTTAQILSEITATDNIDGDISSKILVDSNEYINKFDKPGTYTIMLSVTDEAGNRTTQEVTVTVIDDQAPNWYMTKDYSITLLEGAELTREQILQLLANIHNTSVSNIQVLSDTYSANIGVKGTYQISFLSTNAEGELINYDYSINVTGAAMIEDPVETTNVIPWIAIGIVLVGLFTIVYLTQDKKGKRKGW